MVPPDDARSVVRAIDVIRAKRDAEALSRQAIDAFVSGVTDGSWPDYQTSALLMAIVLRGMSAEETAWLTDAMVRSGNRVDLSGLPGIKVGKHSTGGVGDKVSIVLAPVAAACGVIVPKMSGRGLGHTGGTLDKLEAIPGFRVALSIEEFLTGLREVGCCLIGQTKDIAPADKKLYALRDVTGTVESIPLISASVMSKKLAEGSNALVLDVKCGSGAFMKTRADATALATSLVAIGQARGVRTEAFITAMDTPLGAAVGNALEIAECVETLKGKGPPDLEGLIVRLGSRMVQLAGRADSTAAAEGLVRNALTSGAALAKFAAMIRHQGGDGEIVNDLSRLPRAARMETITASAAGHVQRLDAALVGRASMLLGAGREKAGDTIDLTAGVTLRRKPGDRVAAGEPVLDLHFNDDRGLAGARDLISRAVVIGPAPPPSPLVIAHITSPE